MLTKRLMHCKIPRMSARTLLTLFASALIGTCPGLARAGGEHSGGSSRVIYAETMFRSQTPETSAVKICFDKDPSFKISDADIIDAAKWAYNTWADYIRLKDVTYAAHIPNPSAGMAMQVGAVHAGCTEADDLHLFLGVTPAKILPSLAKLNEPLAATDEFAGYEKVDWKKGFIWFAKEGSIDAKANTPIWPTPRLYRTSHSGPILNSPSNYEFKQVLLHEMGHVFGNNHIVSTIMSEGLYGNVLGIMERAQQSFMGDLPKPETRLVTVDSYRELICNPGIEKRYNLATTYGSILLSNGSTTPNTHALEDAYTLVTGKVAKLPLAAVATRARASNYQEGRRANYQPSANLTIEFKEADKITPVTIEVLNKVAETEESAYLFNGQYGNKHRSFSFSFFGLLKPLNGKTIPVIVNYNTNGGLLSVVRLKGGIETPLFMSQVDF